MVLTMTSYGKQLKTKINKVNKQGKYHNFLTHKNLTV